MTSRRRVTPQGSLVPVRQSLAGWQWGRFSHLAEVYSVVKCFHLEVISIYRGVVSREKTTDAQHWVQVSHTMSLDEIWTLRFSLPWWQANVLTTTLPGEKMKKEFPSRPESNRVQALQFSCCWNIKPWVLCHPLRVTRLRCLDTARLTGRKDAGWRKQRTGSGTRWPKQVSPLHRDLLSFVPYEIRFYKYIIICGRL